MRSSKVTGCKVGQFFRILEIIIFLLCCCYMRPSAAVEAMYNIP